MNCLEMCCKAMKAKYVFDDRKEMCERLCKNIRLHWKGNRVNNEDALLFLALPVVMDIHGRESGTYRYVFQDVDVYVHSRIRGHEIDALILFTKKISSIRRYSILLELKEHDMGKLVKQLLKRRKFATWCYGVIDLGPNDVLHILFNNKWMLGEMMAHGIGLISMYGDIPIVILESTRTKTAIPPITLEEFLKQTKH